MHLIREQSQRQRTAEYRAKSSHESNERRIKSLGRESALNYGQKLYETCVDEVARSIEKAFVNHLKDPSAARTHGAAIPFFDPFKSVHQIAAIALIGTIDQLSRKQRLATFCQNIGSAIEKECRLMRLENKSPLELRRLMRQGLSRNKISSREIMRELGCPVPEFNNLSRLQIGQFLLDHIQAAGLVKVVRQRVGRTQPRFVLPSEEAEEFIKNCPPRNYRVSHTAMICPPETWPGLYGGGILGNEECLIRVPVQDIEVKDSIGIEHYRQADLEKFIGVVNHLQETELEVSEELVRLLRKTWDNGIDGLWPCRKVPLQVPDRLGNEPGKDELKQRNRLASQAHRDREQNRSRRIKIERSIQLAEELAGKKIWQAYHACHRGRVYTSNKYCTTQGPDYEKSIISFANKKHVDQEGLNWLLRSAAGHNGLNRTTWEKRLRWGEKHIEEIKAVGSDPLGNLQLWRNAKDPWQYLQTCKGVKEVLDTGKTGVPVRFDQTTSGCGIIAALLRDKTVGRLCNLYGSDPQDLYTVVAEGVTARLVNDLQFGEERERIVAELWLERGIDRSLCKKPILAAPYGGSYMSLCDSLVDALDTYLGYTPLDQYSFRVALPAKYLASHLWAEMKSRITPVLELKSWLKKVTRKVLTKDYPLEWTTPSGWPMKIADREPKRRRIDTLLFGTKISMKLDEQNTNSPLSATKANKGIAANFTHAMDATFLHNFCYAAGEQQIEVLTNHDCFAVHATDAKAVHELLHDTFGALYAPNWLVGFRDEVQVATGISLPKIPSLGELDPGKIGTNLYLFS